MVYGAAPSEVNLDLRDSFIVTFSLREMAGVRVPLDRSTQRKQVHCAPKPFSDD